MTRTRHITMSTSEPATLLEAVGFVLEQFDEDGGPLHGAEMPAVTMRQILVPGPGGEDADWHPVWEVSVTGSFPQVGSRVTT